MTPRAHGQTFRRLGLLIEAVCMLGLLGVSRGNAQFGKTVGVDPSVVLVGGLFVGFCLWAFGTVIIGQERRKQRGARRSDSEV